MFRILPLFLSLLAVLPLSAQSLVEETITVTKVYADSTVVTRTFTDIDEARRFSADTPAPTPRVATPRKMSHFVMGAELGTGLDLSGTDLSTFNFGLLFGYRGKAIQFLGLGAGVNKSLGTSDTFLPLQIVFRTGFLPRPTLFFMHTAVGYSFNTVASSSMFGDITATVGAGVNLLQKPRFQSYITLSFGFRHFSQRHQELTSLSKPNTGFVQIALGLTL